MNLGNRIKITSLHTGNLVIREIQTQEQLEKYRELKGYDIIEMPVIHRSEEVCVACES